MSLKNTGVDTLDIHGGGHDLIFPHHENEIAQSEGYSGKPFAKYWVHNGFVTINKEKMSKSLGNFFTLGRIFEKYTPREVRWFLLSQNYRSPLDFSDGALELSKKDLRNFEGKLGRISGVEYWKQNKGKKDGDLDEKYEEFKDNFIKAMEDDFDFTKAVSLSHAFVNYLNKGVDDPNYGQKRLRETATKFQCLIQKIFGIFLMPLSSQAVDETKINSLVDKREKARRAKKWAEADRIRHELSDIGVVVEDTPKGPHWWIKGADRV